jgi:hypothetical protein
MSRAQGRTTHWLKSKFIPSRKSGLTEVTPAGNPSPNVMLLTKARQNMTVEAKKLLTPRMSLCADKSVRTTDTIWYSRKENWPSGGLKAVPPFALLISIWLWVTGVNTSVDVESSFLNVLEKLDQWTNAFSNRPFLGYKADAPNYDWVWKCVQAVGPAN